MNADQHLDARQARRMAAEHRYLVRREKLEKKAEPLVGELCREGKQVFYVNCRGGKVRESTSRYELIDFLIRNNYV